ncbi:Uncharacterised protein [uncultured archaeon]|nr:Uncharacterised protein [uncultured archaeon]
MGEKQNPRSGNQHRVISATSSIEKPPLFIFKHLSPSETLKRQVETASQRAILGGIRDGWSKSHSNQDGIVIPLREVIGLLSGKTYEFTDPDFARICNLLDKNYGQTNIYVGLNSFFVPAVYRWAMASEEKEAYPWFKRTLGELLYRMESIRPFLSRKFTQKRHLQEGETGSREVKISFEEYRDVLLQQLFLPVNRADSECIFCKRTPEELKAGEVTVHHILPKGAFRQFHDELQSYSKEQHVNGRGVGDFGQNQVMLCRTPCHNSFENVIEANIVYSSKHPDKGVLFVADLYILLAKSFANHHLYHHTIFGSEKYYHQALEIENQFLLTLFQICAPNGVDKKAALSNGNGYPPSPTGNILVPASSGIWTPA